MGGDEGALGQFNMLEESSVLQIRSTGLNFYIGLSDQNVAARYICNCNGVVDS